MKNFAVLTILIGLLFGILLGSAPLEAPDSARYAEIPREMVVTHDYLTPHLNGVKYFEKPPLFYWLQAGAIKLLGTSELAVSVVNAGLALLCCLIVYYIGRRFYDHETGFWAAIILATSGVFFALTRIITLDMALTTFLTAGFALFLCGQQEVQPNKRWQYFSAMYVAFAAAVMTKGLVGIILPGLIILTWIAIFRRWCDLKKYCIFRGTLIFLALTVPWHLLVQLKNPEFANFYFIEQHFLRYLTPYAGREEAWWFFGAVVLLGLFPWTCFVGQSLGYHLRCVFQRNRVYAPTVFFLFWVMIILVFYSFSYSKLIPYVLPAFPPLALLIGNYLARHLALTKSRGIYWGLMIFSVLGVVLGVGSMVVGAKLVNLPQTSFYVLAGLAVLSGAVTFLATRRNNYAGLWALSLTFMLVLTSLNPLVTVANNHALKPLVAILQAKLTAQDEVIGYNNYYQDVPFYLRRRITVVNAFGELSFGVEHQPETKAWMIDTETFLKRWLGTQRMFMIADAGDFASLTKNEKMVFYPIAEYAGQVLVSNQKNN